MEKQTTKCGRPPKKQYDASKVLQELMDTVDEVYLKKHEIKATATELDLAPLKARKLLITSGILHYEETEEILVYQKKGLSLEQIQEYMGIGRASINGYLPYTKVPYKNELSQNAERLKTYRERKEAVMALNQALTENNLWECIVLFQNYPFFTLTGLPFSYIIKIGKNKDYKKELLIDRREKSKSLSWSSILMAFRKAKEMYGDEIALGDIRGVSYIVPVFKRLGIIKQE